MHLRLQFLAVIGVLGVLTVRLENEDEFLLNLAASEQDNVDLSTAVTIGTQLKDADSDTVYHVLAILARDEPSGATERGSGGNIIQEEALAEVGSESKFAADLDKEPDPEEEGEHEVFREWTLDDSTLPMDKDGKPLQGVLYGGSNETTKLLGAGTFGTAYLSLRKSGDGEETEVVLKKLTPPSKNPNCTFLRGLAQEEYEKASMVGNAPWTAKAIGWFSTASTERENLTSCDAFVVMPHYDSGDISDQRLGDKEDADRIRIARRYFAQVTLALYASTSLRIVHGDIKAENVFISTDPEDIESSDAYVADWAGAVQFDADKKPIQRGYLQGMTYIPPEMWSPAPGQDGDIAPGAKFDTTVASPDKLPITTIDSWALGCLGLHMALPPVARHFLSRLQHNWIQTFGLRRHEAPVDEPQIHGVWWAYHPQYARSLPVELSDDAEGRLVYKWAGGALIGGSMILKDGWYVGGVLNNGKSVGEVAVQVSDSEPPENRWLIEKSRTNSSSDWGEELHYYRDEPEDLRFVKMGDESDSWRAVLSGLLQWEPTKRMTIAEVLQNQIFASADLQSVMLKGSPEIMRVFSWTFQMQTLLGKSSDGKDVSETIMGDPVALGGVANGTTVAVTSSGQVLWLEPRKVNAGQARCCLCANGSTYGWSASGRCSGCKGNTAKKTVPTEAACQSQSGDELPASAPESCDGQRNCACKKLCYHELGM